MIAARPDCRGGGSGQGQHVRLARRPGSGLGGVGGRAVRDAGYSVELDRWDWAAGDNFVVRMSQALDAGRHGGGGGVGGVFRGGAVHDRGVECGAGRPGPAGAAAGRGRAGGRRCCVRTSSGTCSAWPRPQARQVVLQAVAGPAGPPSDAPAFPGRWVPWRRADGGPRLPGVLPPVWNAPTQNAVFTGRDAMLAAVRDALAGAGAGAGAARHRRGRQDHSRRSSTPTGSPTATSWCGGSTPSSPTGSASRWPPWPWPRGWAPAGMDVPSGATLVAEQRLRDDGGLAAGLRQRRRRRRPGRPRLLAPAGRSGTRRGDLPKPRTGDRSPPRCRWTCSPAPSPRRCCAGWPPPSPTPTPTASPTNSAICRWPWHRPLACWSKPE